MPFCWFCHEAAEILICAFDYHTTVREKHGFQLFIIFQKIFVNHALAGLFVLKHVSQR